MKTEQIMDIDSFELYELLEDEDGIYLEDVSETTIYIEWTHIGEEYGYKSVWVTWEHGQNYVVTGGKCGTKEEGDFITVNDILDEVLDA